MTAPRWHTALSAAAVIAFIWAVIHGAQLADLMLAGRS